MPGLHGRDEATGGSPCGASIIAEVDGSRQPSRNEIEIARVQAPYVARIAAQLAVPKPERLVV